MNLGYLFVLLGIWGANIWAVTDSVNYAKEVNETLEIPFLDPPINLSNNTSIQCTNAFTESNNSINNWIGTSMCNINGMSTEIDQFLTFFGVDTVSFLLTIIILLLMYITLQKAMLNMIGGALGWVAIFVILIYLMKAMVG